MSARYRLVLALMAIVAVFFIGAGGYVVLEGASFGDAAFMTLITLSTVGYDQVIPLHGNGRVWTVMIIVLGIGVVSVAYASLLTVFVSGEIRTGLERRRVQIKIDNLNGHTIMCGYGRMGAMTAERLVADGKTVVVLERDKDHGAELDAAKLLYLFGDATEEDVLRSAGLERAAALVTTLPSDADNLFITLTARGLRSDLYIVSRSELPSTEAKLHRAGADRVICPQIIGAKRIADILTRPHVVDFFEVAAQGVELEMAEYSVKTGSALCDVVLRDSRLRQRTGAMVVAIKRPDGSTVFQPEPDVVFRTGDQLILVGKSGTSERLESLDA
ncbi:MAG: potassium channel family protein [Phycisphaerae bacterium]